MRRNLQRVRVNGQPFLIIHLYNIIISKVRVMHLAAIWLDVLDTPSRFACYQPGEYYRAMSEDWVFCSSSAATFEPFSISTRQSKIMPMIKKTAMDNMLD